MSLYCVTFLRNVFEDENYLDAKCYADDAKYHSIADKNYIRTKKLIKGVSQLGDMFVDCVETGIKSAIEAEFLKAIQFSIYLSESNPTNLLESYVFGIDYVNRKVSVLVNEHDFVIDTSEVMKQIQGLVKRLLILTQSLDPLPDEKYFSIRLMFNENCPADYQPPFFQDCSNDAPAVVQVEPVVAQNTSKFQIGSVNTGKNRVKVNVLCKPSNPSVNLFPIDPFDIVDGIENAKEEVPSCSLQLDKFFENEEVVSYTQAIPNLSSKQQECCTTCSRMLNPVEWGTSKVRSYTKSICLSCWFPSMDPDMIVLTKVRLLWDYLLKNKIGSFKELIDAIHTDINQQELIAKVFSRLFCDNVLVVTDSGQFDTQYENYATGCGNFTPLISGIISNNGTELLKSREYFICFVPLLKGKFPFMNYDKSIERIYFPNYSNPKPDTLVRNLKRFKALKQPRLVPFEQATNKSTILEISNSSSQDSEKQLRERMDTSNSLADLSFEDSLVFLSQNQAPSVRKSEDQLQNPKLKKRKISINKVK